MLLLILKIISQLVLEMKIVEDFNPIRAYRPARSCDPAHFYTFSIFLLS